jgi:hypothetical protein
MIGVLEAITFPVTLTNRQRFSAELTIVYHSLVSFDPNHLLFYLRALIARFCFDW